MCAGSRPRSKLGRLQTGCLEAFFTNSALLLPGRNQTAYLERTVVLGNFRAAVGLCTCCGVPGSTLLPPGDLHEHHNPPISGGKTAPVSLIGARQRWRNQQANDRQKCRQDSDRGGTSAKTLRWACFNPGPRYKYCHLAGGRHTSVCLSTGNRSVMPRQTASRGAQKAARKTTAARPSDEKRRRRGRIWRKRESSRAYLFNVLRRNAMSIMNSFAVVLLVRRPP